MALYIGGGSKQKGNLCVIDDVTLSRENESAKQLIEEATGETYEDLTEAVQEIKRFAKARDYINWGLAKNPNVQKNIFMNTDIDDVSMFDFSPVQYWSAIFHNCKKLTEIIVDTSNATNMSRAFLGCTSVKTITLTNTSQNQYFDAIFNTCSSLETINGLLDFSVAKTINTGLFGGCRLLKYMTVAKGSIKMTITFYDCRSLVADTVQNIFDGLAAVETAQTVTFYTGVKLLQSQVDAANAKGWTVAGGTIVTEEEYYGQE